MARAATVIQTKYRTYCEHKRRYRKTQQESAAATCIQNYYRTYKEHQGGGAGGVPGSGGVSKRSSREATPTAGLK